MDHLFPLGVPMMMVTLFLLPLLLPVSSETDEATVALVRFMENINPGKVGSGEANWGWNSSSDPCTAKWKGVDCSGTPSVKKILLDSFSLTGILDAGSLCTAKALAVLSLNGNNVVGDLPEEISNCSHLTHLFVTGNNFTGNLPLGLARLNNLKRLYISNNGFSGGLPNLSRISGLVTLRAEFNRLSGGIPDFDFSNLKDFNVSYNNFSGPIPNVNGQLNSSSFLGNPELCGEPSSNPCPNPPPNPPPSTQGDGKKKNSSTKKYLIYSGYAVLALIILLFLLYRVAVKFRKEKAPARNSSGHENYDSKPDSTSSEFKGRESRSEFSITSPDNNGKSSSLVVLSSPVVNGLKFEDLLRAPAELVGRGKHGTLYKVTLHHPVTLAVKRIKDWEISRDEFKKRMQRINEVSHPNVLPVVAYYCSQQEKLLVYEFQHNGSICKYLNGSQNGETFDWGSRLNIALKAANGLASMHKELQKDGIPHGNLKSSNILLNKEMEPCISEYGLMEVENQDMITESESSSRGDTKCFKSDIYSFGLILLELLTGKLVHNRASDLAQWVHAVLREEWTVEVFDRALISEGASEERMVNLLQVAIKCTNPSVDARPNSSEVAAAINAIKEEEEKSLYTSTEL